MKKAIVIVDVQNYFMNAHTHTVAKKIAEHLENNSYDLIAFTKFVNSQDSPFQKIFGWKKCSGPPDTDICPELKPWAKAHNIFPKSGFSAFKSKKLLAFLKQKSISDIYLCGTDSDACVLASALEGFDLGFRVHALKELCASANGKQFHDYGIAIMKRNLEKAP